MQRECPICEEPMRWEKCEACLGDGTQWWNAETGLGVAPEKRLPCDYCNGRGGYWLCPNDPHIDETLVGAERREA